MTKEHFKDVSRVLSEKAALVLEDDEISALNAAINAILMSYIEGNITSRFYVILRGVLPHTVSKLVESLYEYCANLIGWEI